MKQNVKDNFQFAIFWIAVAIATALVVHFSPTS
jgi:hypothetical protein